MKKNLIILVLAVSYFSAIAQNYNLQLVSSAGDSYQNENFLIDWSVGEIAIETFQSESLILTQGFHQGSLEISTLINHSDLNISMKVYPNPTSSYIYLTTEATNEKLQVIITSLIGTTIFSGEINNSNWKFDFSNYASGTYILLISSNKQTLKSFKIIKH